MRLSLLCAAVLAGSLLAGGCGKTSDAADKSGPSGTATIGLYSSLPIYWPETADVGEMLSPGQDQHWVRTVLEQQGSLIPLDTLADGNGKLALPADAILVLAQPQPLSPDENVALDAWVRSGGRLLLFADPMLTSETRFALGDKRRPQDIVLLAPILRHWGLDLSFDETQPAGERVVPAKADDGEVPLPVNLAGRFANGDGSKACAIERDGLIADCRIGKGRVLAIADAAVLESDAADGLDSRLRAFDSLLARLNP